MASKVPALDELIGRTFHDRFRVDSLLGRGGMGAVYKAQQLSMDKPVALKVLPAHLAEDEKQVQRFKQEGLTSSQLKHPNTIRVIDYGRSDDGFLYLAMELLEGTELQNVIKKQGNLEPARAIKIARQLCKSIGEAHEMGLVHRDLKPGNIFLCDFFGEKDFVKVLDFGIAKFMEEQPGQESLTQTGFICGTPLYIAPEQALGRPVSPATDIYSLGVILYEMLCGHPPFRAETPIAIVMRHIHDHPPPMQQFLPDLNVPPELETLIFQMVSKDPRQRPPSAHEVGLTLEDILSSGILQSGDEGPRRIRMPTRPHPTIGAPLPGIDGDVAPPLPGSLDVPAEVALEEISPEMIEADDAISTKDADIGMSVEFRASKGPKNLVAIAAAALIAIGATAAVLLSGSSETAETNRATANKHQQVQDDTPAKGQGAIASNSAHPGKASKASKAPEPAVEDKPTKVVQEAPKEKKPAPISVTVQSNPDKAEVSIGGKLLGNTPVAVELNAEKPVQKVTLRKAGFKPRTVELDYGVLKNSAQPPPPMLLTLEQEAKVADKKEPVAKGASSKKRTKTKKRKRKDWGKAW